MKTATNWVVQVKAIRRGRKGGGYEWVARHELKDFTNARIVARGLSRQLGADRVRITNAEGRVVEVKN